MYNPIKDRTPDRRLAGLYVLTLLLGAAAALQTVLAVGTRMATEHNWIMRAVLDSAGTEGFVAVKMGLPIIAYIGARHLIAKDPDWLPWTRRGFALGAIIYALDVAGNLHALQNGAMPDSYLIGTEAGIAAIALIVGAASIILTQQDILSATGSLKAGVHAHRKPIGALAFVFLLVMSPIGGSVDLSPVGTAAADSVTGTHNIAVIDYDSANYNGELVVLNENGTEQWRKTSSSYAAPETDAAGRVFAENQDTSSVEAFGPDGSLLWSSAAVYNGINAVMYDPADDKIVTTQYDGSARHAVTYNATTGEQINDVTLGSVTQRDVALYNSESIVIADSADNNVVRFSLSDGSEIFNKSLTNMPDAILTDSSSGSVFVMTGSDELVKLDNEGTEVSRATVSSTGNNWAMGMADGHIAVGNGAGEVRAFDKTDLNAGSSWTETLAGPINRFGVDGASGNVFISTNEPAVEVRDAATGSAEASYTSPWVHSELSGISVSAVDTSETVSGTITSCEATTYTTDKSECSDTPVANATTMIVGVDTTKVNPDSGQTAIDRGKELLEQSRNPLPPSWDPDKQLTGPDGFYAGLSSEYVAVNTPGQWGMAGWTQDAKLGTQSLILPADEPIVLSAWDPSKTGFGPEDTADSDLPGKSVSRDVVVEQLGPSGSVVDTQKLSPNKAVSYGIAGSGKKHKVVETALPAGVYRFYTDGHPETAHTRVVGDPAALSRMIEQDLKSSGNQLVTRGQQIRDRVSDGKFVVRYATTDSNGQYTVDVPSNVEVVNVQAMKIDGETLTGLQEPSPQTMRDKITELNYNGSVSFSPDPAEYDVPTSNADVRVVEFQSPPYQALDAWTEGYEQYLDLLRNGSLSEAAGISTDLSDLTLEELKDRKDNTTEVIEQCETDYCRDVEQRYKAILDQQNATDEQLQEDITDLEGTVEELRKENQALEQAILELSSSIAAEAPESEVSVPEDGNATATLRQAFGSDFGEDDVLVVWQDSDGSTTHIPDDYWSVNKRPGQGDEVVVEDYPLPSGSAGGTLDVTVMSEDGVARGGDTIENPAVAGNLPDIRSVDVSSLRPSTGETVTLAPNIDTAGVSVKSASVYGPDGTQIASSVSGGDITFTPESEGAQTVRVTVTDGSRDYVETVRVVALDTPQQFPSSVRVVDGTLGTYAMAGDELDDAKVEVSDNGRAVDVTALVPEGATPSEIHVYTDSIDVNADGSLNVRVVQGASLATAESIGQRVGVTLHTKRLSDGSIVYRSGGTDGGNRPIPAGDEARGGERIQQPDSTTITTYTDQSGFASVTINNDPGFFDRIGYRISIATDGINFPLSVSVTPDVLSGVFADVAGVIR